jgi:hypothetical protein
MAGTLPMRSGQFSSIVEPILNDAFDGIYDQRDDEWMQFFDERPGIPRSYHEEPMLYGFGAAPQLPEGAPVNYDSGGVLFNARYPYLVYGLAYALTQVLIEDGDHIRIGRIYSEHLAQSIIETKETLCANVLNRGFNSSYTGGDGVSLCNSAHPIVSGTFSNILTTAANLSQSSVEQMAIQIRQAVDNTGKKAKLVPEKLIVAPANMFQAEVILKSVLRSSTANNDINPIMSTKTFSKGVVTVSRLTSANAWFAQTNAKRGLQLMMRRKLKRSMEGDFETDSVRYKVTERYAPNWTDPRGIYGTPGN